MLLVCCRRKAEWLKPAIDISLEARKQSKSPCPGQNAPLPGQTIQLSQWYNLPGASTQCCRPIVPTCYSLFAESQLSLTPEQISEKSGSALPTSSLPRRRTANAFDNVRSFIRGVPKCAAFGFERLLCKWRSLAKQTSQQAQHGIRMVSINGPLYTLSIYNSEGMICPHNCKGLAC